MKMLLWITVPVFLLASGLAVPIVPANQPEKELFVTSINNTAVCVVNRSVFQDGELLPNTNPCEICRCRPPGFACAYVRCAKLEAKPNCNVVEIKGQCCPQYQCEEKVEPELKTVPVLKPIIPEEEKKPIIPELPLTLDKKEEEEEVASKPPSEEVQYRGDAQTTQLPNEVEEEKGREGLLPPSSEIPPEVANEVSERSSNEQGRSSPPPEVLLLKEESTKLYSMDEEDSSSLAPEKPREDRRANESEAEGLESKNEERGTSSSEGLIEEKSGDVRPPPQPTNQPEVTREPKLEEVKEKENWEMTTPDALLLLSKDEEKKEEVPLGTEAPVEEIPLENKVKDEKLGRLEELPTSAAPEDEKSFYHHHPSHTDKPEEVVEDAEKNLTSRAEAPKTTDKDDILLEDVSRSPEIEEKKTVEEKKEEKPVEEKKEEKPVEEKKEEKPVEEKKDEKPVARRRRESEPLLLLDEAAPLSEKPLALAAVEEAPKPTDLPKEENTLILADIKETRAEEKLPEIPSTSAPDN